MVLFFKLLKEESGVTSIEYALVAVLIAVAAVTAVAAVGSEVYNFYDHVAEEVENAASTK